MLEKYHTHEMSQNWLYTDDTYIDVYNVVLEALQEVNTG
jgi:hypothetical protein